MTIGPPQVGKTSLRDHLLGLPPPQISSSTPVVDTAAMVSVCPSDSAVLSDRYSEDSSSSDGTEDSLSSDDSEDGVGQRVVKRCRYESCMCVAAGNEWVLVNSDSGILSLLTFLQQKMSTLIQSSTEVNSVASETKFCYLAHMKEYFPKLPFIL